jgi:hypothetical protein
VASELEVPYAPPHELGLSTRLYSRPDPGIPDSRPVPPPARRFGREIAGIFPIPIGPGSGKYSGFYPDLAGISGNREIPILPGNREFRLEPGSGSGSVCPRDSGFHWHFLVVHLPGPGAVCQWHWDWQGSRPSAVTSALVTRAAPGRDSSASRCRMRCVQRHRQKTCLAQPHALGGRAAG